MDFIYELPSSPELPPVVLPEALKDEFWRAIDQRQYEQGKITDIGGRLVRFMAEHSAEAEAQVVSLPAPSPRLMGESLSRAS